MKEGKAMRILCHCGWTTSSPNQFMKHQAKNGFEGHGNVDSALGHLIIRGFEEDKPLMEDYRQRLIEAGVRD